MQIPGVEGRAEGAHDARDGGPGDVATQLLLEGPEHRVVVEGAALHHDVLAQIVGVGGPDDLVDRVLDDGDGQSRGDVLHAGAVLLGLLDAGVHEYGAAGAQVDRVPGQQAQLGKVGDGVAQGLGKGLDEGAAAGGAGLVEHDGVHRAVADFEALHVLAADVDDEVHVGVEVAGGAVVGHRLHQPGVAGEGIFDEVLAVAGDGRALDGDAAAAQLVDLPELLQHDGHRVAQVGVVVGVEQAAVGGNQRDFGGGGTGVDAQPGGAGVGVYVHLGGVHGVVTGQEGVVLLLAVKEGGHGVHQAHAVHALLQPVQHLVKGALAVVGGAQGRAHGGKAVAVLGEHGVVGVQLQGLHEALPQAHEEVEGAAQEDDLALELPALGEAGHRLIHHGLEDRGRHVLLPAALVEDGLDVALGKDAAAGGDGVDLLVAQAQLVQLVHRHVHEGGHLVDESAGAAGAVHPLLQRAAEKDDFGVLAAQFDDRIGVGYVLVDGGGGGVHLLHEVDLRRLGHAQAGRAGDDDAHLSAGEPVRQRAQSLGGPLPGLGVVPLIGAEQQFVLFVQQHHLDSGGANINANTKAHSVHLISFIRIRTVHNISKFDFLQPQSGEIQDVP